MADSAEAMVGGSARPATLPEFGVVRLTTSVEGWGRTWPPGTRGTIVDIYEDGIAYAVEFDDPEFGIATVRPHQMVLD